MNDLPEYQSAYLKPQRFLINLREDRGQGDGNGDGFIVRGGPWEQQQQQQTERQTPNTASIEDFPSFGTARAGEGQTITWGPRPR